MDLAERCSERCTGFIDNNSSVSKEDLEKIKYGIHVLLLNIFKLLILFVMAYFLNILQYTFVILIAFGFLRSFASGMHADSSIGCTVSTILIFIGGSYLSIYVPLNNNIIFIIFVLSLGLMLLYAPADTKKRPFVSKKLRKSLKIKSVLAVILLYAIVLFIKDDIYKNLITYGILVESLLITPLIYKIFGKEYKNYEKI